MHSTVCPAKSGGGFRWRCPDVRRNELVFFSSLPWSAVWQSSRARFCTVHTRGSGGRSALLCPVGHGQHHAGGTLGTVPGRPYRGWGSGLAGICRPSVDSKRLAGLRNVRSVRTPKPPGRGFCRARHGRTGARGGCGRGIYESVRTDHHEPLGREGLVHSLDLLEQLAGKVPVYHLACDISEDAVKTLEQEIYRFVRK